MPEGHCPGCDFDEATLYGYFAQLVLTEFRADPFWARYVTNISQLLPPEDADPF